ncbi:MAG: hypothetical protein IKF52_05305 [Clostridia bacterium]|nr:hypothetical protein [Clostridia bacterium]
MEDKDNRELRYVEEFELVDSETQNTYSEKDVYIEPFISKDGTIQFKIYNNEKIEIGIVDNEKLVHLDNNYIKSKENEKFEFDSDTITADIKAILDKQLEKEKAEINPDNNVKDNINNQEKEEKNEMINEPEEVNSEKDEGENDSPKIEDEELKEQGYNITAYSRIRDKSVIDAMKTNSEINPRSVIVAEVDGEFKFLGKEKGTGKITELKERPGGNNKAEEVNKFRGNIEEETGRGKTMIMADYGNMEFAIKKNNYGQIEVGYIKDFDESGNRELISVETDVAHPTMSEYRRAQQEKYESFGYNVFDPNAVMTKDEIEQRLSVESENVRNTVKDYLENQSENPTLNELEEKINVAIDENKEKDVEQDKEIEDDEQENWGRYGMPRPH